MKNKVHGAQAAKKTTVTIPKDVSTAIATIRSYDHELAEQYTKNYTKDSTIPYKKMRENALLQLKYEIHKKVKEFTNNKEETKIPCKNEVAESTINTESAPLSKTGSYSFDSAEMDIAASVSNSSSTPLKRHPTSDPLLGLDTIKPVDVLVSDNSEVEYMVQKLNGVVKLLQSMEPQFVNKSIHKQYKNLIDGVILAKTSYHAHKNLLTLQSDCDLLVNDEIKREYNTHRDTGLRKTFGDIIYALNNFFTSLFSAKSTQENEKILGFFNTSQRVTKSGHALYEFKQALDKVLAEEGPVNNPSM